MIVKLVAFVIFYSISVFPQSKVLIYMDLHQTDHLKAYGITYNSLTKGLKADWLLNYRGGSFMIDYTDKLAAECRIEGVSFETLSAAEAASVYSDVQGEDNNKMLLW